MKRVNAQEFLRRTDGNAHCAGCICLVVPDPGVVSGVLTGEIVAQKPIMMWLPWKREWSADLLAIVRKSS